MAFDGWERLRDAVAAEDYPSAIALAAEAWRLHRAAELGDLVDALDDRIASARASRDRSEEAFHATWMSALERRDDAALGGLLRSIGLRWQHLETRLEALGSILADPRMTRVFAQYAITHHGAWWALDRLIALADTRVLPFLARNDGRPWLTLGRWISAIGEANAGYPPLEAEETAMVQELLAMLRAREVDRRSSVDALLRDVELAPDDDDVRLVLADALLLLDPPRGELVQLQLEPPDPKIQKRVRSLLNAHEKSWIPPAILGLLANRIWRRGFLDEATLRIPDVWGQQGRMHDVWALREALVTADDGRELALLRRLRAGNALPEHYVALLSLDTLRGVRSVEDRAGLLLGHLETIDAPLEHPTELVLQDFGDIGILRRVVERRWPSLERLVLGGVPEAGIAAIFPAFPELSIRELVLDATTSYRDDDDLATWFRLHAERRPTPTATLRTATSELGAEWTATELTVDARVEDARDLAPLAGLRHVDRLVIGSRGRETATVTDPRALVALLSSIQPRELHLPEAWATLLRTGR